MADPALTPAQDAQRTYGSACPSCGAPVRFLSAASTHAVCAYCQSTLVRDGESLARIGKAAELLDDYSPLQVMAQGQYQGKGFTVAGRVQYQYEGGVWTEWYCALADGTSAWLSEDNGSFVWGTSRPGPPQLPAVNQWSLGRKLNVSGQPYVVAAITQVTPVGMQGELPKWPTPGQSFTVVELRSAGEKETTAQAAVLSFEYSSSPPEVFRAVPVALDSLRLSGLKDPTGQGGEDKKLQSKPFNCPNCASPLEVKLQQTRSMSCRACNSLIDLSQGIGAELKSARQTEPIQPLIPLGSVGVFDGHKWQVVGYQHRTGHEPADPSETFGWEEYLLFHRKLGFQFLVDSVEGWSLVKPLTNAPSKSIGMPQVEYAGRKYKLKYHYKSETGYVCGEFYWKVERGQKSYNCDYSGPDQRVLSSEQVPGEITWSEGARLEDKAVAKAFKMEGKAKLFQRESSSPFSLLGLFTAKKNTSGNAIPWWVKLFGSPTLWMIIIVLTVAVAVSRCSGTLSPSSSSSSDCDPDEEDCSHYSSGTRVVGGSHGGYSSGGGHK